MASSETAQLLSLLLILLYMTTSTKGDFKKDNYTFQVCLSNPKGFNFTISGKFIIAFNFTR